ncbi:hypothetical protein WJ883_06290, partial [Coxiella burnetii]
GAMHCFPSVAIVVDFPRRRNSKREKSRPQATQIFKSGFGDSATGQRERKAAAASPDIEPKG